MDALVKSEAVSNDYATAMVFCVLDAARTTSLESPPTTDRGSCLFAGPIC